jgi:hypothetical protein
MSDAVQQCVAADEAGASDGASPLISVFAGPTVDRAFRCLALIVAAALLGACAHVGRRHVLTDNEQLVASALSWAVRVPPRASEYKVDLPAVYPGDAILAAAAAEAGLTRRGTKLLRAGESAAFREPVRITVQTPHRAVESAAAEFRVPFAVAVGGAEPIQCVVRIRLEGDDPRSWIYAAEGAEHCWPRPGAWSKP